MPKRANKSELQKIPYNGRIIWAVIEPDGTTTVCRTHQTLSKLKGKELGDVFFIHTKRKFAYMIPKVTQELFDYMLDEWRDHYFDEDWFPKIQVGDKRGGL